MRSVVIGLAAASMLGGLIYFGVESIGVRSPVLSYFIEPLDAAMENEYWNRLEPGWMVFDSTPSRSVTLFARPVRSSATWYEVLPDWFAKAANPDPYLLQADGFGYVYLSASDWDTLQPTQQLALQGKCVIKLKEVSDWTGDFRRLLDIRACQ